MLRDCYNRSVDVAVRALPKSPANKQLRALMLDMSDSLISAWYGEYSKMSEVNVVASYGRWAVLRTVILTGGQAPRLPPRKTVSRSKASFAWMADRALAARLERRWARIKDADCAAYPVPKCQQRLEEAFRLMLDDLVHERMWTRRRTPRQR